MEWSKELLEIFEDPLFDDVKVPAAPVTADDRMQKKIDDLREWIEQNGREPQRDSKNIKEKVMSVSLETLKNLGLWT